MTTTAPNLFAHPGLQPIRPLLEDARITEIMINGPSRVYVEIGGQMQRVDGVFQSDEQLRRLIDAMVDASGRMVNTSSPFVDFTLPDGSRVNVIIPPIALDGAAVTIRKFTRSLSTLDDLIQAGTLTRRMAVLLAASVKAKLNLLFAGATGTGKTTTLGILSAHISPHERIVTIEDTAELALRQEHVVRLECRPANLQGAGEVKLSQLVRNAMRMRPHRIIVGEVRGDEAMDMIAAITSGHDGCLAVVHASSPRDAMTRLETFMLQRGLQMPLWAIHKQIAAAIDLVVQHTLGLDGVRRITHITEVGGLVGDAIELRDLFRYEYGGEDQPGRFVCTGLEPMCLPRFDAAEVKLPADLFKAGED